MNNWQPIKAALVPHITDDSAIVDAMWRGDTEWCLRGSADAVRFYAVSYKRNNQKSRATT